MQKELLEQGWLLKGDYLVRYSKPRIGWKPADGTLVIGYHEYPEKVTKMEQLNLILCGLQSEQ